jgi:hypothetical protein
VSWRAVNMTKTVRTIPASRQWRTTLIAFSMSMMFATPAHAQMGQVVAELINTTEQMVMKELMSMMGLGLEGAVEQSGAAVQAEIMKSAMTHKAVVEGLEAYREQSDLQTLALNTSDSLQQPVTTCQTMAAESSMGGALATKAVKISANQARVLHRISANMNTALTVETAHQATNAKMCTPQEASLGICKPTSDSSFIDLAGADQQAAFLFTSKAGSSSYAGGADGPQAVAVNGYIDRVVTGVPPQQLSQSAYATSPAARAYMELIRRYKAVLSMASFSLNQVKESHNSQTGLGTATSLATIDVAGYEANKADMSMFEAVERLVAVKFSPTAITDAATAKSPTVMLRDMDQMMAFKLWMDNQSLQQETRTEALMAEQLALLTEKTLRPQLEAQRAAATRAAAAAH